jgi:SPP1 gp7 family putative phage head morphogenesis protein
MPDFRFDAKSAEAVKAAKKQAGALVTNVSKKTKQAIKNIITTGIKEGMQPSKIAKLVKETIGLTPAQSQAVLKFRQQLETDGLASSKVDKKVAAYAEKLLKRRADTIARTEVMDALNEGQKESWRQAQERGDLPDRTYREVIVTEDETTCVICGPMQGKKVLLDEEFDEGDPPFHPKCRCTVGLSFQAPRGRQ